MPPQPNHMTIEKWFFLLVTALVLFLFWQILEPFILVIILATVVTIVLSPIDKHLKKILKRPRLCAAILSIATFFLVFIPILTILLLMVTQASDLVRTATSYTSWLDELKATATPIIQALPGPVQEEISSVDLAAVGKSVATWAFQNIGNLFSSSTQLVLNTFIFFLCLYYLLVNRENLYQEVLALSPLENDTDIMLLKRIVNTIRGVVFGVLLVAIIQGVIAGIGMTIFGVPGSLIWGALTAVAGLVPLLGTAIVLIPAVLYLFFTGSTVAALGLFIWAVVFVAMIDNLVGPYLIGGRAHLHSFLVLISVLGGLAAFGSVGAIAGPTILAALLGLMELYKSGILLSGKLHNQH
ncbi:AI-2E family transporter [Patescibacteria group bacterium]|nr:MAG: AI-2E family transporter [Patescibacteria group bacterium]